MVTPTIRWALLTTWLVALLGALSIAARDVSGWSVLLMGLLGVTPPVVLFVLMREPPNPTGQVIRKVEAR